MTMEMDTETAVIVINKTKYERPSGNSWKVGKLQQTARRLYPLDGEARGVYTVTVHWNEQTKRLPLNA
jgi:hypothetical protein